jgi:hypothetical protein
MRNRLVGSLVVAVAVLFLTSSLARADDNWLGTWKLNPAKSKFAPGTAPKSQTLAFEKKDGGVQLTTDTVDADGKAVHGGYVAAFDGKEVAFAGNPDADTTAPKRVDANHYVNTWKKDGKLTRSIKASVAPGGKVLTIVQTGKDAKGRAVQTTAVFDKQ